MNQLNCIPTLTKNDPLHNNTVPLIISNNSNFKSCIHKHIIIATSGDPDNGKSNINDITSTARDSDFPNDIKTNANKKTRIINNLNAYNATGCLMSSTRNAKLHNRFQHVNVII